MNSTTSLRRSGCDTKRSSSANRFKHRVVKDWQILDVPCKIVVSQCIYASECQVLTFGRVMQDDSRKPDETGNVVRREATSQRKPLIKQLQKNAEVFNRECPTRASHSGLQKGDICGRIRIALAVHARVDLPCPQVRARDRNMTTTYCRRSARSADGAACTSPSKTDNTTGARVFACCLSPVQESRRCERGLPKRGTSSSFGNIRELLPARTRPGANVPFSLSQHFSVCACDHVSSTSRSTGTSEAPDEDREICFLLATSICVYKDRTACTTSDGKLECGQQELEYAVVTKLTPQHCPPVLWSR